MTPDVTPQTPEAALEPEPNVMTFNNLHESIENDCDCINQVGVAENLTDMFVRRVWTGEPTDGDFRSWREESRKNTYKKCDDICNFRGVSMSKVDGETEEGIISRYKTTVSLSPTLRPPFYCRLKLRRGAGFVKHSPSQKDKHHHTLFKSDTFSIKLVEVLEVVDLR